VYVFHDFSFSVRVVLFWKKKKRSDTSEACHLEFMPDNDPVEISQPPADPGLFDHMEYGKLKFHVKPDDRDDRDSSASSTQTTTKEDRRLEPPRKADPKVFERNMKNGSRGRKKRRVSRFDVRSAGRSTLIWHL
jgi:translation initiation factor IF-3